VRRPSYSELEKKLKAAKELLKAGQVLFCDNNKVDREILDLAQLGIEGEEIHELLVNCISEILSGNVSKSYEDANGRYPPTVSIEPQASGKEYWPFCWTSELGPFKGKHMYLKFVLLKESYLYLSLHEDDKGRKK
jgi:hypothetical protein